MYDGSATYYVIQHHYLDRKERKEWHDSNVGVILSQLRQDGISTPDKLRADVQKYEELGEIWQKVGISTGCIDMKLSRKVVREVNKLCRVATARHLKQMELRVAIRSVMQLTVGL